MAKKYSNTIIICTVISKGAIYLLTFLLPIFFLPWTVNVLDFNKQALLVALVLISLFAWLLKILISGEFSFNFNWVHIPIVVLFSVLLISTFFSLWRYGSFWGWPQVTSESLLSMLCLILLYFLVINIFKKKEIFCLLTLLIFSGFLAIILGVFQLFGKFFLPFDFAKIVSFNTIGTLNNLGIFTAVLLPLVIFLIMKRKALFLRIFFILVAIFSTILIVLINSSVSWWLIIIGAILVITLGMQKREFFDTRWLFLPMFFLALALFFSFFKFPIPGVPLRPSEVFLSHRTSFEVAWETLKERPVLGSGPGTFIFDFSKYKKINFNQSPFWNVRFDSSSSKILNDLSTTGVLGILSLLVLMGLFIFYGIKSLFENPSEVKKQGQSRPQTKGAINNVKNKEEGTEGGLLWAWRVGIFISFVVLTVGYFLYQSNLSLNFIYFLLMAGLVVLSGERKEFFLKPSSLATLGVTFIFTLVFVFSLGVLIFEGQRYAAEVSYFEGIKAWQQRNSDDALKYLEKSVRINPRADLYWRELSQVYLRKINELARRKDLSREEINRQIQLFIAKSVNSAKAATDTNPKNVANWSVRGFIYQNMIGIITGVKDWALKSYEEAAVLEPTNPYFPTQEGIVLLREALFLPRERETEKEEIVLEAQDRFEKATELKSDYAPARFQIAMVYQAQGKQEEAIKELETAKSMAPLDVGLAFQLGVVYYQDNDYQKAQVELERAVLLNRDYSNALYFLGLTYDKLGQKEKAIEKFNRVNELNPDNLEVKEILINLKAGKNALEGIIERVPPTVPIEKTPEELQPKEKVK